MRVRVFQNQAKKNPNSVNKYWIWDENSWAGDFKAKYLIISVVIKVKCTIISQKFTNNSFEAI